MLIVAGLSLKNLQPRVWDSESPYYIPSLRGVMVSYGDLHTMPAAMDKAKQLGLRAYLGVPEHISVYLDNGAFYFLRSGAKAERRKYTEFVRRAKPD